MKNVYQSIFLQTLYLNFTKIFFQCSYPGWCIWESSRWFNCHSWVAKKPHEKRCAGWVVSITEAQAGGKRSLCLGLPTPSACFWDLWKWGRSKQTIRPDEWIMMHMFTEWKVCSTFLQYKRRCRDKDVFQTCICLKKILLLNICSLS